jgi:hypothetical protein
MYVKFLCHQDRPAGTACPGEGRATPVCHYEPILNRRGNLAHAATHGIATTASVARGLRKARLAMTKPDMTLNRER